MEYINDVHPPVIPFISDCYHQLIKALDSETCEVVKPLSAMISKAENRFFAKQYLDATNVSNIPLVISQQLVDELENFTGSLSGVLQRVFHCLVASEGDKLSEILGSSSLSVGLATSHQIDTRNFIIRHDMLISHGQLKLIEVNAGSSVGGWQHDFFLSMMEEITTQHNIMSSWNVKYIPVLESMFVGVVNSIRRIKPLAKGHVVLITDEKPEFSSLIPQLKARYERAASLVFPNARLTVIYSPDALEFSANAVYFNHQEVDAVLSSSVEPYANTTMMQLALACSSGSCFVPDSPNYSWINDKSLLALAHEVAASQLLNEADCAFIKRYIPWGCVLGRCSVNSEAYHRLRIKLLTERENMVLKKAQSLQGRDVFIGRFVPEAEWQKLIDKYINDTAWLAQAYCAPDTIPGYLEGQGLVNCTHVLGVFDFCSRYRGGFIRAAWGSHCSDGVINSAKGATELMLYQENKKKRKLVI